ncbi:MAG: YtxH domain-containing protein [Chloroflexi bacterium]|nr:YtxH domain-containing protein [Chloroflexota bacterium]
MADEDRGPGFFTGFVLGSLIGAFAALLLAPRPGDETREQIKAGSAELRRQADELAARAREKADEMAVKAQQTAEELIARGKEALKEAVEEGKAAASKANADMQTKLEQYKRPGE